MIQIVQEFHPLTLARLKTNVGLGIAVPSLKYLHAESRFFSDISSELTALRKVNLYMAGDINYGLRGLLNSLNDTVSGTPIQDTFKGIKNNGVISNYLSQGTINIVGASFGNHCFGFYCSKAGTIGALNTYAIGGSNATPVRNRILYQVSSGNIIYNSCDNTNSVYAATFNDNSTYCVVRPDSSNKQLWINGVQVASAAVAASSPAGDNPMYLLNARETGAPGYSDGVPSDFIIGASYYGSNLVNQLVMHNAFNRLYAALN